MIDTLTETQPDEVLETTVSSLRQSTIDLRLLREECTKCADEIGLGQAGSFTRLGSVAELLHAFNNFQMHVCVLFNVDQEQILDPSGNLASVANTFCICLQSLLEKLKDGEYVAVANLLRIDICDALTRFEKLTPALTEYIETEYAELARHN